MKPAYFANIRFKREKRAARPCEGGSGLEVFDTDVAVEIDPRGLPVWNTFVMLMCSGDILTKPLYPRADIYIYRERGRRVGRRGRMRVV